MKNIFHFKEEANSDQLLTEYINKVETEYITVKCKYLITFYVIKSSDVDLMPLYFIF